MSIPTIVTENCSLEYLDTDWKLASLYAAFLVPKTQQEAIRLIYGMRTVPGKRSPPINRPVQWVTNIREDLMERGFLSKMDNKLKGSIIKANIEPIVQSLIIARAEDSDCDMVQLGIQIILESYWFRNFFSYDAIHSPITYKNGQVYEPYQNLMKTNPSGNRLEITTLKNRIFQLLYEIGYYSHHIRWLLKREKQIPRHRYKDPLLNELLHLHDFDHLCSLHSDDIPQNFIEMYRSCIAGTPLSAMASYYPERLFRKLLDEHASLFIPSQISILLRSAPCVTSIKPMDCGYLQGEIIKTLNREKRRMNSNRSILD